MIDPSKVAVAFPHGLGRVVVLKRSEKCPGCGFTMEVWLDPAGGAPSCLGCSVLCPEHPIRVQTSGRTGAQVP